jgi:hypothetical protein
MAPPSAPCADRLRRRGRAAHVISAGAAAIAMFALIEAPPLGAAGITVASGPVRLIDQTTDAPAPPPGFTLPPGTVLPPGAVLLPDGLPLPPLPPGMVLPPEVPQMLMQGMAMMASPPPNVPNEVCRFNTVRVPCP